MQIRDILLGSAALALCGAMITPALASSHREAPAITEDPKVDGTDLYMFRSYESGREDTVTLIANYQPLQASYGGPNYFTMDPEAIYEIHIDTDGDAVEDLTFQFDFDNNLANGDTGISLPIGEGDNQATVEIPLRQAGAVTTAGDPDLAETESYELFLIQGDRRTGTRQSVGTFDKPLDNIGSNTVPNYDDYASQFVSSFSIPGCGESARVFVGQRAEAFAVNLGEIFDLVNLVPIDGDVVIPGLDVTFTGGITQNRDNDDVVGEFNVTSLALEVPIECLGDDGDNVIGAWTTASLPQASIEDPSPTFEQPAAVGGAFVQQSRLSNPLVNELVIGLGTKNSFNASEPVDDGQFAVFVTNPTLPALLDLLFRDAVNGELGTDIPNLAPSNIPRTDLVAAFLTGIPGINQPTANTAPIASEMMRLNVSTPITPVSDQNNLGVLGGDPAGFPNGRRPGDDVVDIALRVVMGALCHLDGEPFCSPADAPVGLVPFTDGAPIDARDPVLQDAFPYLGTPIPGAGPGSL